MRRVLREMDVKELKDQVRTEWNERAKAWRKWYKEMSFQFQSVTKIMMEEADVKQGMNVLDIASGAGEPAISIARAMGTNGHVTATDLAPEMVQTAEDNSKQSGLTNMTSRVADAESLPFGGEDFDLATCRFGVMFFPNVQKALREARRVLKQDRKFVLTAWGPMEQSTFHMATMGTLTKYIPMQMIFPPQVSPFRFQQSGSLSAELTGGGFRQVHEETRNLPLPWPGTPEQNLQGLIDFAGSQMKKMSEQMPPQTMKLISDAILSELRKYYDGNQVNLWGQVVLASGIR